MRDLDTVTDAQREEFEKELKGNTIEPKKVPWYNFKKAMKLSGWKRKDVATEFKTSIKDHYKEQVNELVKQAHYAFEDLENNKFYARQIEIKK